MLQLPKHKIKATYLVELFLVETMVITKESIA